MRRVMGLLWLVAAVGCSAKGGTGPVDTGDGGVQPDVAAADQPQGSGPDAMQTADAPGDLCGAFCARADAASCPAFDRATCMSSCASLLAMPTCRGEAQAAYTCGVAATITCGPDGDATSTACDAQIAALTMCLGSSG